MADVLFMQSGSHFFFRFTENYIKSQFTNIFAGNIMKQMKTITY